MEFVRTIALFVFTAIAEIVGCYLPWVVLKQGRPIWLLIPAAGSLALFAWLLTLHPICGRSRVCRLRRGLCGHGGLLAVAGGRHAARSLGRDRKRCGARRNGDYLLWAAR